MKRLSALTFLCLFCIVQSSHAFEPPTMAQMQRDADRWLLNAFKTFDGNPAQMPARLMKPDARAVILKIYSQNWSAVAAYANERLENMPLIDAQNFKEPRETLALLEKEAHAALTFAKFMNSEDALLILRYYEPEALANIGYSMLLGSASSPSEFARNTVISSWVSRQIFRTELDGMPAIGISSGYWTVLTAYTRSEHGLFVPKKMALFNRKFED